MPQDESNKILDPCPNCATLIDVTECEPFSEIHCPICGSRMRVRRQFNHFALQQVLGEGGMGTVFEALDTNLLRPVALKILKKEYSQDEESIAQLETEARITASINHPHVVKVFSAGRDHAQFYLAMELVGAGTLDQLMGLQIRVAEIQVLDVGIQIADGLRAALQRGLIHRDVKPGNILFSDAHTSKIVDFGLALLMEDESKARGEIWGTPYYVAPEKLNNEAEDFRSDIYSLGGTLFHAISGRPPFEAASASLVALKHLKSQAVSLQAFAPDVSNETAYVINRMLHKDPFERYQSYDELIEHLGYAKAKLLERSTNGNKERQRVVVETEETRTLAGWITLALIIVVLGAGGFLWFKRESIFGPTVQAPVVEDTRSGMAEGQDVQDSYDQAIKALSSGDNSAALDLFDKILSTPDLKQPLLNWARTGKGLALLLNGQAADATTCFSDIQADGMYSNEGAESPLANFFVETGRLMSDQSPISSVVLGAYSNSNFESCALLLFALKDWNLGRFSDAGPFMQKFKAGNLEDNYAWLNGFKPVADKYIADYILYNGLRKKVETATTPELRVAALKLVGETRSKLALPGPLPELLGVWENQLTTAVTSLKQATQAQDETNAAEEAQQKKLLWDSFQTRIKNAQADFAPEKVIWDGNLGKLNGTSFAADRDTAIQRLNWLAAFKKDLITALSKGQYQGSLVSRKGVRFKDPVVSADLAGLQLKNAYGTVPVAWKDLSAQTIQEMGTKLLPVTDKRQIGARARWLLGAYCISAGLEKPGRQFLLDAAQVDPVWSDKLTFYFDTAKPVK